METCSITIYYMCFHWLLLGWSPRTFVTSFSIGLTLFQFQEHLFQEWNRGQLAPSLNTEQLHASKFLSKFHFIHPGSGSVQVITIS